MQKPTNDLAKCLKLSLQLLAWLPEGTQRCDARHGHLGMPNTIALLEPYFRFTHLISSDDWNVLSRSGICFLERYCTASPMHSSETFRRHAVECGEMANFLRNKEDRVEWNTIADRYRRCAQWYETRCSLADQLRRLRRNKKPVPPPDHAHS
jgi:hypothetical protein